MMICQFAKFNSSSKFVVIRYIARHRGINVEYNFQSDLAPSMLIMHTSGYGSKGCVINASDFNLTMETTTLVRRLPWQHNSCHRVVVLYVWYPLRAQVYEDF